LLHGSWYLPYEVGIIFLSSHIILCLSPLVKEPYRNSLAVGVHFLKLYLAKVSK
jgi:hypothetical protein